MNSLLQYFSPPLLLPVSWACDRHHLRHTPTKESLPLFRCLLQLSRERKVNMATPQQLADGLCLRCPVDIGIHSTFTVDMAVNFLLEVTQVSLRTPYTWGYIDRPADGAGYFIFIDPQTTFPNDGMIFQKDEQRHLHPVGGRMVEIMEAEFGFIPGSGETIASRVRRRFRLIEGGNPQLVLVHYNRNLPGVAVNPDSHQPTRVRSPQPVNLPAVYVAGEKAGQNVFPSTAHGPPVGGVSSGVPEVTLPDVGAGVSIPGPGAGELAHEPDPNKLRGKQRSFKISDQGWILLPDRKRGGSRPLEWVLEPPQPSKKRKIAGPRYQSLPHTNRWNCRYHSGSRTSSHPCIMER